MTDSTIEVGRRESAAYAYPERSLHLPAKEGRDKRAIAARAIEGLVKMNLVRWRLRPTQADPGRELSRKPPARDFDLLIEATSERMDWKKDLFQKVAPHLGANAFFASSTFGLCITELARTLACELQKGFCGIHFLKHPRYMRLVELVPTAETDAAVIDRLESFLTTTLGKVVIRAKSTPNSLSSGRRVLDASPSRLR